MDPGPAPHCFSLSTSTVWARCPGLRGTLSQHITKRLKRERERESRKSSILPSNSNIDSSQRSDSHYHSHCSPYLEKRITFAIEANEETLLCVTRYINTGILLFPTLCNPLDLTIPLELIRLATDWGMVSLVFEVIFKISYARQYNFLSIFVLVPLFPFISAFLLISFYLPPYLLVYSYCFFFSSLHFFTSLPLFFTPLQVY